MKFRWQNWIAGFILATLMAWGIGMAFLTSPTLYVRDERLNVAVPKEGTFKQERAENWSCNRFGCLGLEAGDAAKLDMPHQVRTLIFGDSYIEAAMVPGPQRMQNQLGGQAIGIGFSGFDFSDYLRIIPRYLQVIDEVETVVIFIGDIYDIEPGRSSTVNFQPKSKSIDVISYHLRLYAFRALLRKWRNAELDFIGNHGGGNTPAGNPATLSDTARQEQYFHQLLQSLKAMGQHRYLIVYAPTIPRIAGGKLTYEDANRETAEAFAAACREERIGFLDLGPVFAEDFRRTGKFPRGFFNTPVGEGHLNARGHQLAGLEIKKYLHGK